MLGSMAVIIPERKQAHHSVRNALEHSQDSNNVEFQAAIFAAGKFAEHSENFSVNVCSKITEMVRSHSTPLEMKLKLISVFQHMRKIDASTAAMVRQTLIEDMLPDYPAQELVLVTLHTLTLLSAHTLIDVPDQVELLLRHLIADPRSTVKRRVLTDLRFLANENRAHLWSRENIESIITFAQSCNNAKDVSILCGSLSILYDLVKHTDSTKQFFLKDVESPVLQLCRSCCYGKQFLVAAKATQLLTSITATCVKEMHQVEGTDIVSESIMSIEALFLLVHSSSGPVNLNVLKECLRCCVMLCKVKPETCDQFVDIIGGGLNEQHMSRNDGSIMLLLCETLASLGHMKSGVLKLLLPDICMLLSSLCKDAVVSDLPRSEDDAKVLIMLCTLLFQTMKGHLWTTEAKQAIDQVLEEIDQWSAYRIGRNASRYGHHGVASAILNNTANHVASENLYFWLKGLSQICQGEYKISGMEDALEDKTENGKTEHDIGKKKKLHIVNKLSMGNMKVQEGLDNLKASATPQSPASSSHTNFQLEYMKCRAEYLSALRQMVVSSNSLRTSPPPAIASTQAKQSHDDLQRCGRITALLRSCVADFSRVGSLYGTLYESSFDADPDTLCHIQVVQHMCLRLSQWIEMVCLKSSLQGSIFDEQEIEFNPPLSLVSNNHDVSDYGIDIQDLVEMGETVAQVFQKLVKDPECPPPITNVHTECLIKVAHILASNQICFPRYFYQSLQATSIKLAVTPQPRSGNEPINVSVSQYVAIKVEGVITSSTSNKSMWRTVSAIKLTLNSTLQQPTANQAASLKEGKDPNSMMTNQSIEKECSPHNDFFAQQFLIHFPIAGTHQLLIDARLVDEQGITWKSGVTALLNIKAFEDGQNRASATQANRPSTSR
jgi:integrator complex subunit 7